MASAPPILLLTAVLFTACSDPASVPTARRDASLAIADDRGADAALFVGNLSFLPTDAVLRYTGAGTFIDRMVPVGSGGLTATCCMAFGPDENLYVASPPAGGVLRYNGVTGAFIDVFIPAGRGGLVLPTVIEFKDGKLYVADGGVNAVRRYDALTGASLGDFVPPGDHGLTGGDPGDFEFGPDDNLYVSSLRSHEVLRYDGVTGAFIDAFVPSGYGGLSGPRAILFKEKIAICHSRGSSVHTVRIGYMSGFDHVAHGDAVGPCR
jgi:hypothetical protein